MDKEAQQKKYHCTLPGLLPKFLFSLISIENKEIDSVFSNVSIFGMTLDSRKVQLGDLFIALNGAVHDGRVYIESAIKTGAAAVISETTEQDQNGDVYLQDNIIIIKVFNLPQYISAIAMRFYFPDNNCHQLTAVTGTNGKTTIASLLTNCYAILNQKSAQMGTIGNGLCGQLKASLNTTLDAISVCKELKEYQSKGAVKTVMEVSSHGLIQGRVAAIPFTTGIFTNLTRDHLDYHGTMQAYADAKKTLFEDFPLQHKIINADDATGQLWLKQYSDAIAYGINANATTNKNYFKVTSINYLSQGIVFDFISSWGLGKINAPFYGDFNVSNIAAVCCALFVDGFSLAQVQNAISQLTVVPGRMEQYLFKKQGVTFVVDYAHTPDALSNALQALQKHKQKGRVIAVFACGGDRDKGKRPEMAKVAELGAEKMVIVDDNPRSENAVDIIADIKKGLMAPEKATVIHDRKEAILHLLKIAQRNDIILIAGKGHEDYQIFGDKRVHYSDRECLSELVAINNKGKK